MTSPVTRLKTSFFSIEQFVELPVKRKLPLSTRRVSLKSDKNQPCSSSNGRPRYFNYYEKKKHL